MKTNTAETSINCYHDVIKGQRENSEDNRILQALLKIQPATGRMLARETGIENSNVARSLNNLWKKRKRIYESHRGSCPITGVRVKFYRANNGQLNLNFLK